MAGQELDKASVAVAETVHGTRLDRSGTCLAEQMGEGKDPRRVQLHALSRTISASSKYFAPAWDHHCEVAVVPEPNHAPRNVWAWARMGVSVPNGPGDSRTVEYAVENIRKLIGALRCSEFAWGTQLCGLALGGKTSS